MMLLQQAPKPGLARSRPYTWDVPRKLARPRPKQAQRLVELRLAAGLSQAELADVIGEPQANVAFWERTAKPPRSDVLPSLAAALGVHIEELFVDSPPRATRAPAGKVQQLFDEVRRLPRRKQERVVEVVVALLKEYKLKAS
ncbi:MAG: helix-turn-helix transcriptional regulator [Polyangiaceae bacterium]|nr:helix-turn-helix transcriptional regulator [Polyangiaceae bacterium]MBK8938168.1 helix-turn-helix transcriptional regulator [Polyangiaceae bacterium]